MFGVAAKVKLPQQIVNVELTERLFHVTRAISLDLAAANIQRSRDHGLQSYTAWRKFCDLTPTEIKDFDDLRDDIRDEQTRNTLKDVYKHVDNIDVWAGGILEDNLPGAKVGPLFRCLIIKQLKALRDGDRFYMNFFLMNMNVFPIQNLYRLDIGTKNLAFLLQHNWHRYRKHHWPRFSVKMVIV